MGALLDALRSIDGSVSPTAEAFDRIAAPEGSPPDFEEHSTRIDRGASSYRLTFYFDVHRRGAQLARDVGSRFVRLCGELAVPVPPSVEAFVLGDGPTRDEVVQVVLGIDAPLRSEPLRCKYYLVLRGDAGTSIEGLLAALSLAAPPSADPKKACILGIDLGAAGLDDVKLYFRLDQAAITRVFDAPDDVAELLSASREVIFQQCIKRPGRRQAYLHMPSPAPIAAWLARFGHERWIQRMAAIGARLGGDSMEPWIVAFACSRRRLVRSLATVYWHRVPAGARMAPAPPPR